MLTDAHLILWGLTVGVPVGFVIIGILELFGEDTAVGEFWQAFKEEGRDG
jgi:hypothetical protein